MRSRSFVGILIALLGLLIAYLQLFASAHYLYWEYWWYDIMMHLLGGLLMGAFALWFLRFEFRDKKLPLFIISFVFVLCVGVAWEIFEYFTDSYGAANYTLDTTLDLLMDVVGMMSAYLIFKRL